MSTICTKRISIDDAHQFDLDLTSSITILGPQQKLTGENIKKMIEATAKVQLAQKDFDEIKIVFNLKADESNARTAQTAFNKLIQTQHQLADTSLTIGLTVSIDKN